MRITRIEIQGRENFSAVLSRAPGSRQLTIEILGEPEPRRVSVLADDRDALWRCATTVQTVLDGARGSGGDIRAYLLPIELMSDV